MVSGENVDFFSPLGLFFSLYLPTRPAVHCNLSQNGIDHQLRPEDMTSQLEEDEELVDAEAVLLDDDSPSYPDLRRPSYHRRSPPHRSVSESELTRVRHLYSLSVLRMHTIS